MDQLRHFCEKHLNEEIKKKRGSSEVYFAMKEEIVKRRAVEHFNRHSWGGVSLPRGAGAIRLTGLNASVNALTTPWM